MILDIINFFGETYLAIKEAREGKKGRMIFLIVLGIIVVGTIIFLIITR